MRLKMNKILKVSLIILISLLSINAGTKKKSQYKGPVDKITLASASNDVGFLVYIAEKHGYFMANGLDVTINDYEAGKLATDALVAGQADISTGADFVLVSHSFDNPDLRAIGTIATARDCKLIFRKDHGIEKPEELRSKKIGITKKSSGEFYLGRLLTFNNLSMDDVEILDLKPGEIIEAVVKGDIDAALTWEPYIYNIKKRLGEKTVVLPGQSGQDLYFLLISREDWLKNHSYAVDRLLKAFIQAEEFVKNNEKEAKEFLKNRAEYESDYIDYVWKGLNFTVTLPQALLLAMDDQARWRIENGLTDRTEIPNYLDYIYLDGLLSVEPEAVTIIH